MTFSLAHTITVSSGNTTIADVIAPWTYHFETFMVARGWTVTANYLGQNTSTDFQWLVEKTVTNAINQSFDQSIICEIETSATDMIITRGDGTSILHSDSGANTIAYARSEAYVYRWWVSDESDDSWLMTVNGKYIGAIHFNYSGIPYQLSLDTAWHPIADDALYWGQHSTTFGLSGSGFQGTSFLVSNNWNVFNSAGALAYVNTSPDILFKANGQGASGSILNAHGAYCVLLNGKYYLDLTPSSATSLMFEVDQDYGIL